MSSETMFVMRVNAETGLVERVEELLDWAESEVGLRALGWTAEGLLSQTRESAAELLSDGCLEADGFWFAPLTFDESDTSFDWAWTEFEHGVFTCTADGWRWEVSDGSRRSYQVKVRKVEGGGSLGPRTLVKVMPTLFRALSFAEAAHRPLLLCQSPLFDYGNGRRAE